jgi:hypothetical protein
MHGSYGRLGNSAFWVIYRYTAIYPTPYLQKQDERMRRQKHRRRMNSQEKV